MPRPFLLPLHTPHNNLPSRLARVNCKISPLPSLRALPSPISMRPEIWRFLCTRRLDDLFIDPCCRGWSACNTRCSGHRSHILDYTILLVCTFFLRFEFHARFGTPKASVTGALVWLTCVHTSAAIHGMAFKLNVIRTVAISHLGAAICPIGRKGRGGGVSFLSELVSVLHLLRLRVGIVPHATAVRLIAPPHQHRVGPLHRLVKQGAGREAGPRRW